MNIVAFIAARSGSKSIPDKNIKELGGKPLIVWSIEHALKAGIPRIIVNSDSEKYLDIARAAGSETMLRPASLAGDKTSMLDVLKSEIPKVKDVDLVMLLQPTVPFRKTIHTKLAIEYFTKNLDRFDSLISVERVPEKYNPYHIILENKSMVFRKLLTLKEKIYGWFTGKKFVGPNLGGYPITQRMTRRQDLPQCWVPTGSIYIFKAENLKSGSIYGNKEVLLLETEPTININEPDDWTACEDYLKEKK